MNKTYLFITALFVLIFMSCQSAKKNNTERQNEVELVAEKQLAFPLDEQTYYSVSYTHLTLPTILRV